MISEAEPVAEPANLPKALQVHLPQRLRRADCGPANAARASLHGVSDEFVVAEGFKVVVSEMIEMTLNSARIVEDVLHPAALAIRKQRADPAG